MPGLFSISLFIKMFTSCIRFTIFDPNFHSLATQDKLVYLLVSFLVPISVPSKHKKRMLKNYSISLFLFYAECLMIIFTAVILKNHYHFDLFRKLYQRLPQLLQLGKISFELMSFLLLVICFLLVTVASLLIYLATTSFHPLTSLFKPNCSPVVSDVAASKV